MARSIAEDLHPLVRRIAPELTCPTWSGFPACPKDAQDKEIGFFHQFAGKFTTSCSTAGFNGWPALDEGSIWPSVYAITAWDAELAKTVTELITRALA